jgi:hypothetical protein
MANKHDLEGFLSGNGITQTEVAGWLGMEPSAVSRKLARLRRWTEDEIKTVLARTSERLGRAVTFEEAFGEPLPPTPDLAEAKGRGWHAQATEGPARGVRRARWDQQLGDGW